MKVYIAGPMRNYKDFNFPAFDSAAHHLTCLGHKVTSPAAIDRALGFDETKNSLDGFNVEEAMHRDFAAILENDAIALLPGWQESTGARAEVFVAQTTGRAIFEYLRDEDPVLRPVVETIQLFLDHTDDWLADVDPVGPAGETRVTNALTGGQKGSKLARYDLIPTRPLHLLAEHFGRGSEKYEDRNWEKGYDWSLSFAAMQRHAWAFWGGEDIDPETGSPHLAAVAWHAFAMLEWGFTHPEMDDRPTVEVVDPPGLERTYSRSTLDVLHQHVQGR